MKVRFGLPELGGPLGNPEGASGFKRVGLPTVSQPFASIEGHVPLLPKAEYSYSPRLAPVLQFDPTGSADELPELLAEATRRPLNEAEAWALAEALRKHEPWLEWAGKREAQSFAVDPVALHIHKRVSAQAILRVAAREDVNRSLFADPEQEYNEAVQLQARRGLVEPAHPRRQPSGDVVAGAARGPGGQGADDLHRPTVQDQIR
jgi:hypothetical protein